MKQVFGNVIIIACSLVAIPRPNAMQTIPSSFHESPDRVVAHNLNRYTQRCSLLARSFIPSMVLCMQSVNSETLYQTKNSSRGVVKSLPQSIN
jgi:hypothetical protein